MTTQQFFKGLGMALIAVLVMYFSTSPVDFLMMGVAAASAVLVYVGKNLSSVLHSDSPAGSLSWINAISGILIAVGTGIVDGVVTFLIDGAIVWPTLLRLVVAISLTYLGGTFFAGPHIVAKK